MKVLDHRNQMTSVALMLPLIAILCTVDAAFSVAPLSVFRRGGIPLVRDASKVPIALGLLASTASEPWKGDVVSNTPDGKITGCTLQQVDGSVTNWIITIDGVEADLGRFSDAIYKKLIADAKRQRFQGFRPGTIPPHLEPTYRAFTMDECARETVLEAMQQNNIRPFEDARMEMKVEQIRIPPPAMKKGKKSKKRKTAGPAEPEADLDDAQPEWLSFETMKEAIDSGWRPGQSFSFVATNVKGQRVKDDSETAGATPLGLNY